ncbi:MAG: AAA family ATPase [Actinobacteria bacterium]|nr:AAA family ATPase [Actinomycetota bacterium]
MAKTPAELGPKEIYRECDVSGFNFRTTAELAELSEVIGQARAVSSVEFGMGIRDGGYNIFAVGPTGRGSRLLFTSSFLGRRPRNRHLTTGYMFTTL